jgi:hypothetical protein
VQVASKKIGINTKTQNGYAILSFGINPLLGLVFNSQKCDNTFVSWY